MNLERYHSVFFVVLFFTSTLSFHSAYATTTEGCELFDLSFECDLSGWMKLVMGDLAIGAVLALLLHYLSHRSNVKIEENTKIAKENSRAIQKIIVAQEESRNRRKIYVVQTLKNHFSSILLSIGLLNKILIDSVHQEIDNEKLSNLKQKQQELKNLVYRSRDTLALSIDIFDPLLIDQIEKFFVKLDQVDLLKSQLKEFPNYEEFKEKIVHITQRLDESVETDTVLK